MADEDGNGWGTRWGEPFRPAVAQSSPVRTSAARRRFRRWVRVGIVAVALGGSWILADDALARAGSTVWTEIRSWVADEPDPDEACRDAFETALAAGSHDANMATLSACNEDQWLRLQKSTPLKGVTLQALCDARYFLPTEACGSADRDREARESHEAKVAKEAEEAKKQREAREAQRRRPSTPVRPRPRVTVPPRPAETLPTGTVPPGGGGTPAPTPQPPVGPSGSPNVPVGPSS